MTSRGASFIIAEYENGSSTTTKNCAVRGRHDNKDTEQKKCPPTEDGHNPRSGQETQNPVRCAARDTPSAITHIGCVYADGPSIRTQCDLTMTQIKRASIYWEHLRMGWVHRGKKKARWLSGLQTIFLEENSGDRCHYGAARYARPMMNCDTCHHPG
jgi:hypothetical protein